MSKSIDSRSWKLLKVLIARPYLRLWSNKVSGFFYCSDRFFLKLFLSVAFLVASRPKSKLLSWSLTNIGERDLDLDLSLERFKSSLDVMFVEL